LVRQRINNTNLQEIVRFHESEMRKASYPCDLNVTMLEGMKRACHFFPSLSSPSVFFSIHDKSQLPGLEHPVLKNLTMLQPIESIQIDKFVHYLKRINQRFLVLVESYNFNDLYFIKRLSPEKTYYCQEKLLCNVSELNIDCKQEVSDVSIRNFVTDRDEAKYAAFYNKVLGFLAGKPVGQSFVDGIVARPSFDARGYFIAEAVGKIVGFLSIEKEPWGEQGSGFGYIYQIGVVADWQGSGLAAVLLEKARQFSLEQGINRIGVGVRKSNLAAVNFFRKHGFCNSYAVRGYLVDTGKRD
jgi:ribosomal protein S18 acetylase RimI-like enzyme